MESASENSFAWTDTSSDSFDSNSMAAGNVYQKSDENCDRYNHTSKKRKARKSLSEPKDELKNKEPKINMEDDKSYHDTTTNSSIKKNMIKLEPQSDNDVVSKKKNKIKIMELNGNQNDSKIFMSYDETYLNMKVKQEESAVSCSAKHKHKKRKRKLSTDSTPSSKLKRRDNNEINESSESKYTHVTFKKETEFETESKQSKKKKKKSKKKSESDDHNLKIEDKMDIEETIVNKQEHNYNEIHSAVNYTVNSVKEDNTFQDESEVSTSDEISAIKCDDDHNLHAFINKSTEEENTKNCNDHLSTDIIRGQNELAINSIVDQDSTEKPKATSHRTSRISDRIRFEDEDDTYIESGYDHESDYEKRKTSSKLIKLIKTNPNLKLLSQNFRHNSNLTLNDEIWILKCPKGIDIKDLKDTSMNIHGRCKIKIAGQTYDGNTEDEESATISLLTMEHSKYQIRNIPLNGIINLRKRIPKAHYPDDNIIVNNQTNFIPLPDTKCRHPLFGSNYKKALKIPAAVAERLNVQDNVASSMKAEKRKKKNKKCRNTSEQVDSQMQSELILKSESGLAKEFCDKPFRKKKRKIIDDEGPAPKKVKRIKHDPESAEAWESERAIEENLFNF